MSEIDVSKCELIYNDGRCFGGQRQGIGNDCHKSDYCKYNPNCYYKQLQQLKAENEGLKSLNDFNIQKIEALETETEELKSEIRQKKRTIMMNNDHYHNVDVQNRKYKQCLNEIEEICQNETINLTDSCVNGGRYFEILQLIKQAKEGGE